MAIRNAKIQAEYAVPSTIRHPEQWITDQCEKAVKTGLIEGWSQTSFGIDPDDELGYVLFQFRIKVGPTSGSIDGLFAVGRDIANQIVEDTTATVENVEVW